MARGFLKRGVLAALVVMSLQGCVAVAPALLLAANAGILGFVGYKTYQSQTGGEVEIGFENDVFNPVIQDQIGNADSIAFYPAPNRSLITAAERAPAQLGFGKVVPPATASALIVNATADISVMTTAERLVALSSLADAADVDLVLALASAGEEANLSTFQLRRMSSTEKYHIFLYDRSREALLWTSQMSATVPVGARMPNEAEIYDIVGQALVDRLADFAAGRLQLDTARS